MLWKWGQRLGKKASLWQNVLIDNGETQLGLEGHIQGHRGEDVRQAVSKTTEQGTTLKPGKSPSRTSAGRNAHEPGAWAGWTGRSN